MFIRCCCYASFSLTIQERLMENLGYTGPHNFRKHTPTARWTCVWAPGSGVSLWIRLLNKHSSLNWLTCAAACVLPINCGSASTEFLKWHPRPAYSLTCTHRMRRGGSVRSPNDWVGLAAKGFKQCSVVLRKVCLNGLSAIGRNTSIIREVEHWCSEC